MVATIVSKNNELVISKDGSILPLSVLDQHKLCSNERQWGIRYWNSKWQDWSFYITSCVKGADVTPFFN
jgi:hypothetical protein